MPATPEQIAADYLVGLLPATRAAYRTTLQSWWTWCDLHRLHPLTDVRRVHIEMWGRYQHEILGLELRTVASRFTPVCGFYDYAHAEGHIPSDPGARVRRPRIKRGSTGSWLTRDQLIAFLAAATGHRHPTVPALAHLLALSGLRIGETLALDIGDVGTHRGLTTLALDRKGHHKHLISVPAATAATLPAVIDGRDRGPLLRGLTGARLTGDAARAIVADLGRRAGADRTITPHSLRRTFVTLALDAGVGDRDIMASTGHTSPEMIWHYDMARAAVERNAGHQLADWLGR
ncbi:MAG: tyrosine-type recombinase/integrase [Gordonia sp. (in: high G+C Gram-positive bacteria)]